MHNNCRDSMKENCGGGGSSHEVMDGSDIMELVENEKVFSDFVDHKFHELDTDGDGKLSMEELQPAVKDIGAALGLPAQGASLQSDHIYTEVLNEFTNGKQEEISKTAFKEVLSDFLIGMAAGLKRDPVVILRMDGEDLHEFITCPNFEPEMISIFSEINDELCNASLKDYLIKAFEKLTVDHGMPPAADPWVMKNILEPAFKSAKVEIEELQVSQENFLSEFTKITENVVKRLEEQPAIVAHSQNTFNGSRLKRFLSNKFELNKSLDSATKSLPRDQKGKISNEYLSIALDSLVAAAGLPHVGAVDQMDSIMSETLKTVDAGDGRSVKEEEFKKILTEVLESMMLQLEGSPVSVSVNSLVHEQFSLASIANKECDA